MKRSPKKLTLARETLRVLDSNQLYKVAGGVTEASACQTCSCETCKATGCDTTNLSGCCSQMQ